MQKWEYLALVQQWNIGEKRFYWGDDENDNRNTAERLNALGQEGWELVSGFASGSMGVQFNYLLKRPIS